MPTNDDVVDINKKIIYIIYLYIRMDEEIKKKPHTTYNINKRSENNAETVVKLKP